MARHNTHGVQLQLGDGATPTENFTSVGQIISVVPPGFETGSTELRDHDMVDHIVYRANKLSTIPPVTGTLYFDPALPTHQALLALTRSKETVNWRIVLPDNNGEWVFSAFMQNFTVQEMESDTGLLIADFSLQPTGDTLELPGESAS